MLELGMTGRAVGSERYHRVVGRHAQEPAQDPRQHASVPPCEDLAPVEACCALAN